MTTRRWIERIELAVMLWVMGLAAAQASTYYVTVTGSDGIGNNGSSGAPWRSVTNAVAHASVGDVIQVAGGVYTQNVVMATTNVTIQGGYNSADWTWSPSNQLSVIVGTNGSPVTFMLGTTNTLRNLTLLGGNKASQAGVVLNATNCGAVIEGCVITGNVYGVYFPQRVQGATLTMRNTLVARNSSYGIYAYTYDKNGGMSLMYNCTIADNGDSGYYCYCVSAAGPQALAASNTLFTGNGGFAIYLNENTVNTWGGVFGTVANSLFYGNARGPWCQQVVDGGGNKFSQDPKYADAAHGDYSLQTASPAAAAGVNISASGVTNDLQGVLRPGSSGWDMGAYQGSGTGAPPTVAVGYISKSGSDATGNGSSTNPWATITYALGCLNTTGMLYVASGIYTDNVCLGAGKMAIRGGYNPSDWSWDPANQRTLIVGGRTNPPVSVFSSISTNTLSYLTLCGGTNTINGSGGAGLQLSAWSGCFLFVDGCTITGNTYGIHSRSYGAGMTVRNTLIARNSSHGFYDNLPRMGGGSCRLLNCTVANNGGHGCYSDTQSSGFDNGPVTIYATNTLFTGNNGYAVYRQSYFAFYASYSLFSGNSSGLWNGVANDVSHNRIGLDPMYADSANNNYALQSASPAAASGRDLSAAGVTNDITGRARPGSSGWDMGAYQGSGAGTPPVAVAYVSKLGSDTSGDGSSGNPWASIGYGAGRLSATGNLYIASGVYTDSVWLGDSAMTLRGGYNPSSWAWDPARERTAIFGNSNSPVVLFATAGTNTLNNLTLYGSSGGGVWINAPSPCMLIADGCTITGNTYGVAQYSDYGVQMQLRNCLIALNSSNGIHAPENYHDTGNNGYIRLYNCTVANNGGHGFYITANIPNRNALPTCFTNTLFTGNTGYGVFISAVGSTASGSYSLFYGNGAGAWTRTNSAGTVMFTDAGNNITNQDPAYVSAASGNFRLSGKSSPAYNTGVDLTAAGVTNDLVGVRRPKYGAFDRGAYEFTWSGSAIFMR